MASDHMQCRPFGPFVPQSCGRLYARLSHLTPDIRDPEGQSLRFGPTRACEDVEAVDQVRQPIRLGEDIPVLGQG
jgi:hypothetical protein